MKKIIISIVICTYFFMGTAYGLTENESSPKIDTIQEEGKISTEKIIAILVILAGLGIFVRVIQKAIKS